MKEVNSLKKSNIIIHGLWIGTKLSPIELMTLHSFVDKGHTFQLWVYNMLENKLPKGVVLKDANSIIPYGQVFTKKTADPRLGIGKGSFGTFSDLFRYKLLYEHGGWWVDMDIVCLRTFDFEEEYFFRAHPLLPMIGNIIKCPPKSLLMKRAYEEVQERCSEDTIDWLLTNQILNDHIKELNLQQYIFKGQSNMDDWLEVERYIYTSRLPNENWYSIHWMNEEWRSRKLDKNVVFENTFLHQLYEKYEILITTKKDNYRKYRYWLKQLYRNLKSIVKGILLRPE